MRAGEVTALIVLVVARPSMRFWLAPEAEAAAVLKPERPQEHTRDAVAMELLVFQLIMEELQEPARITNLRVPAKPNVLPALMGSGNVFSGRTSRTIQVLSLEAPLALSAVRIATAKKEQVAVRVLVLLPVLVRTFSF